MEETNHKLPALGRLYLWATYRLYNEFAWTYDLVAWIVSAGRWRHWRQMALDYVQLQPVLEIGFGTGELLIEMIDRGWQVAGIDLSPAMHRVTARKLRQRGIAAPRLHGRAQALPYPDQTFGSVVATFPAEYIVDPASLSEFHRVLKPGGRLIVAGIVVLRDTMAWNQVSHFVFGAAPVHPLNRVQQTVESAGLQAEMIVREDPPWLVPIIVAQKQP